MNNQEYFRTLVLTIPRAKRKQIELPIRELSKQFKLDADELINHTAQGQHWAKRTESQDDLASVNRSVKQKKEFPPVGKKHYLVETRGFGSYKCSLTTLADTIGLSENAIRVRLSKGGGKFHMKINDNAVTITRTT